MFEEYNEYFQNLEAEVRKGSKSEHTIRSYRFAIDHMINYFGIESLDDIRSLDAKLIKEYRNDAFEDVSASTVNARFRGLSAFFGFLLENEYIQRNPLERVKNLKEEKKIKLVLSDEECDKMLESCENIYEKVVIVMLLSTGARRGELVNILRSDVRDGHVRIIHGKGNKQREVPIQPEVEEFLNGYFGEISGEYVVVSQRGHHQVTPETIRYIVKKVGKQAGIEEDKLENLTPHVLRRTAATSLLNNNVESFYVRDFLGHSNVSTTARYAHVNNLAMDESVLKNSRKLI